MWTKSVSLAVQINSIADSSENRAERVAHLPGHHLYLGTFVQESKVAGAAAFGKFMAVLQAVADAPQPPTAALLARACGYPRPTVYRILAALAEQGMVSESGGAYRLGHRLMSLASRAWGQFDLRAALAPELQSLRDQTGETVHLAVPAGHEMIYIDKLESPGPVRMVSRVGASVALHSSAVGKAYLAALDETARERVLRDLPLPARMPATLNSLPALREALGEAAARGYAIDNEENEPGIVCYGVALCDAAGRPVAGVSVSTLLFRRRDDPQSAYIEPLLRLRDAAAAKLAVLPVSSGGA